jgi:hypothetical protein
MNVLSETSGDAESETLLEGYREMASDPEREREALEWCEGLVADAFEASGDGARP